MKRVFEVLFSNESTDKIDHLYVIQFHFFLFFFSVLTGNFFFFFFLMEIYLYLKVGQPLIKKSAMSMPKVN